MMRTLFFILISCLALGLGCRKTKSEKLVNKWKGDWMIMEVKGGGDNSFSDENPFGTIHFYKDGSGLMEIKNYDYSDEDMGIKIRFYVNDGDLTTLYLVGLRVIEVNPGYEDLLSQLPCEDGQLSLTDLRDLFESKKKYEWEISNWPPCLFNNGLDILSKITWIVKKI